MDPILIIVIAIPLVVTAILTAGYLISGNATSGRLKPLTLAAERLGVVNPTFDGGAMSPLYLGGSLDGGTLVVQYAQEGLFANISYNVHGTLPPDFSINELTVIPPSSRHNTIVIGEPGFDKVFFVRGDRVVLSAIFDADTRALSLAFLPYSLTVVDDTLRIVVPYKIENPDKLVDIVNALTNLSRRLRTPKDINERLAGIATRDPAPGVRLLSLELLIERFQQTSITINALHSVINDPYDLVRVVGAIALGDEGLPILQALAASDSSQPQCLVRAVAALGSRLPIERSIELIERGQKTNDMALLGTAMMALGRIGGERSVAVLTRCLYESAPLIAAQAATALGDCGELAESSLIRALDHFDRDVRVNAAGALAKAASVAAVAPLHEAIEHHTLDLGFRRAALGAINAIKERATGAAPGQLALTVDEAGAVSLAGDDPSGQVTLAETPSTTFSTADSFAKNSSDESSSTLQTAGISVQNDEQ